MTLSTTRSKVLDSHLKEKKVSDIIEMIFDQLFRMRYLPDNAFPFVLRRQHPSSPPITLAPSCESTLHYRVSHTILHRLSPAPSPSCAAPCTDAIAAGCACTSTRPGSTAKQEPRSKHESLLASLPRTLRQPTLNTNL